MRNLLTILFSLFFLNCSATTYFVNAITGNNSNNGTSTGTAWQTVSKVNSFAFLAGDIVQFNRGDVFAGPLTVSRNGVTYGAYGSGAQPIITGLTSISTWTNLGSNIWESTSAVSTLSTLNMVVINGVNTPMGRHPNTGWFTYQSHVSNTSITSSSLNSSTTNWTGAEAVFRTIPWMVERNTITNHSGSTLTVTSANPGLNGNGLFIQNDVRTLDAQNEWYYNPSTKKLRIFSTSMPTGVQVTTVDRLVLTTSDNLTFSNIDFLGANSHVFENRNGTNITIQNCTLAYAGIDGIFIDNAVSANEQMVINGNTFHDCNNNTMEFLTYGSNILVQNNTITNSGIILGTGLYSSTPDQRLGVTQDCIVLKGAGSIAEYNNINGVGHSGIYMIHSNNIIVRYNLVQNWCNTRYDGGGIYSYNLAVDTPGVTARTIDHNITLNSNQTISGLVATRTPGIFGIYLDGSSINTAVTNNTTSNCFSEGIHILNSGKGTYSNNTCYNNIGSQFGLYHAFLPGGMPITRIVMKHNIYFAKTASQLSYFLRDDDNLHFTTFGTSDSNYFARPISDNTTIATAIGDVNTSRNLAQYQTFTGQDAHSKKSPVTITNVNQLDFQYNATNAPVVKTLPFAGVDVTGTSYSGTTTLQPYTSLVLIATGSLITPTITWNNPAAITYPTALSGTQLNATSGGVPGTFVYTPASGTVLNAGTQTLSVTFTPTDGSTYTTASKQVTIVVNKAAATLTYSNLTQTYTGSPLSPTITTSPAGLTVVSTTYDGVGAQPINAGSYAVVSGLSNPNYTAPTINGTFTINKAAATINISNLNQIYNGTPRPITASTSPVGLSGLSITYNGSATVPTNAGSYAIVVSLTNPNYTATNATGTLVIAKATPTVSWSNPSAITYPTALSGSQLNATASVAGTFTYTPASGTILNAGTQTLSVNFTPTDAANYNSVNNTTVTLVVNKGTATISLSNLAQVYDGTGKSAIATTNPVGLNTVTILYNGSATLPINAGTYAVVASLNNPNYNATNGTGNLVISKATATLSISNNTYTYDGTPKSVTITTSPLGLSTVSVTYNGSGTPPTNAGSYPVIASLSNANYQATNATGTLTINKATPVISWSNPSAITYPTALSGSQLNATSTVPGTFVYTPVSGTILNAGTYSLIADFTPTDGTNYNSVNGTSVILTVNKGTATISISNLNQQFDGNPKPVTVSTSPAGLGVLTVTYNGSTTAPSAVGSYTVNVTLANSNYNGAPATGTLVISSSSAAVTITNLSQTYTGSPLPVTVTTNPPGLPTDVTYNGSATVPTNVGTYAVVATINDGGVHTGSASATLVINKANPIITWSNPSSITYGTALSGVQLNATASVAGTFTYTPASGVVLNAGTQTLSVGFVPTDAANYNSIPVTTVTIVVNKAVATLTLSNLNQAFDGTQKSVTVTSSPVGLTVISVTYDGSATAPSAVGSYAVSATLNNSNYTATPATGTLVISTTSAGISISNLLQVYTGSPLPVTVTTNPNGLTHADTYNGSGTVPTNSGSYTVIATLNDGIHVGADTQTLVISKATPVITWANPANISYGTALSGTQLNASTGIAGTFTYSPLSGTVLNAGANQNLSVTFVPTDAANYNSVNKIVTITVTQATATLSLSNLSQTYNGTPRSVIVTSLPLGLSGVTILYNGSSTPPTNAGSYPVSVSLVNTNYVATPVNGTLVIAKAVPILSWAVPQPIQFQTPLTIAQLNATANIAGTFSYNPALNTILNTGTHILSATFTPTDATNYSTGVINVPLSVYGTPLLDFFITNDVLENLPNQ